mmetsp:Transcript_21861/g.64532  ORF Transcript_21861/g.64532 Transcript_21861/m.64532 type:complete len:261 (+) Transcript_21861:655-1437(+)
MRPRPGRTVRVVDGDDPHSILQPRRQIVHELVHSPHALVEVGYELGVRFRRKHLVPGDPDQELPGLRSDGRRGECEELSMAVVHAVERSADAHGIVEGTIADAGSSDERGGVRRRRPSLVAALSVGAVAVIVPPLSPLTAAAAVPAFPSLQILRGRIVQKYHVIVLPNLRPDRPGIDRQRRHASQSPRRAIGIDRLDVRVQSSHAVPLHGGISHPRPGRPDARPSRDAVVAAHPVQIGTALDPFFGSGVGQILGIHNDVQ